MPDTDLRAQFEQRLGAILGRVDSGDDTALTGFDALLVEMQHALGEHHPETLRAELVYVSIQESGRPWSNLIVHSLTPQLEAIAEVFGDPSEELVHARFLAFIQDAHQFVAMQSRADAAFLATLDDTERIEFDLATAAMRNRLTLEARPVVAAIAHLLGVGAQLDELVDAAGAWATAMARLHPMAALATLPEVAPGSEDDEGLLTICQMLLVAADRAASMAHAQVDDEQTPLAGHPDDTADADADDDDADDDADEDTGADLADDETLDALDVICRLIVEFLEATDDDPEWDEFRDDHGDAFALATLMDAGLALPTNDGATAIEALWDELIELVEFVQE